MTLSVYVHIPFCSKRCDYCDFATWTDKQDRVEEYIGTLFRQWKFHIEKGETNEDLISIFFGGGTPNLIEAIYIAQIVEEITDATKSSTQVEVTVESNPDHISKEKLDIYKSAGVNRISLGIQSTNDSVLRFIGREHNPEHVVRAVDLVRNSGFENISGDLIYGSPNESVDQWKNTLEELVRLDLNHISAYALGVESGTPLGAAVASGEKANVDEDDLADKYEIADAVLSNNHYDWYEISNWARPGFESRHNLAYWCGGEVIALGCAAHGFTGGNRWSTPRHIDSYLGKFSPSRNANELSPQSFIDQNHNEEISREQETFSLKLRTKQGISWPFESSSTIVNHLVEGKFVNFDETSGRISLTLSGRLMASRLSVDLFEEYKLLSGVVE